MAILSAVFKIINYVNQCLSSSYKEAISPLLGNENSQKILNFLSINKSSILLIITFI